MTGALVLAYGNPLRGDDGLGPAAAGALAALGLPGVDVQIGYQPALEDAADAAEHALVVFVDAARSGPAPYSVCDVAPDDGAPAFVSHGVAPAQIVGIARRVFGRTPRAVLLGIRGYAFGLADGLSPQAARNLAAAIERLRGLVTA